jgi:hypothetical protein
MSKCEAPGCEKEKKKSIHYCQKHANRLRRTGSIELKQRPERDPICIVHGCSKLKTSSAKYCKMHATRLARTGMLELRPKKDKLAEEIRKDASGCWIYEGYKNNTGYGRLCVNRKSILAHRLMYERTFGPIPNRLEVCHKCDNPACVNPDHLFLGTHLDNMRDMVNKGREAHVMGEHSGNAKLKESQVIQIYNMRNCGLSSSKIAILFGVGKSTIKRIMQGQSWKCLNLKGR